MSGVRQAVSLLLALIAFVAIAAFASASLAGTLRIAETYQDYCALEFIGPIEPGDGAQFEKVKGEAWPNLAICLDSKEGDFAEATAIVRDFGFTTMIAPGANCSGACSILFMGGRHVTGNSVPAEYRSRVFWPGGKLVFHGPPRATGEDAFAAAMKLAADFYELNQRHVALGEVAGKIIPDTVLRVLLETTPDQPYAVETAGDLIAFDLADALPRFSFESTFTDRELRNACQSHLTKQFATPHGWGYFNKTPDHDFTETREKAFEWSEDGRPLLTYIVKYETKAGGSGAFGILSGFALQIVGSGNSNQRKRMCIAQYRSDDRNDLYPAVRLAIVDVFDLEATVQASGAEIFYSPQNERALRLLAETIANAFEGHANSRKDHTNRFLGEIEFTPVSDVYLRDFTEEIANWQNSVDFKETMKSFVTEERQIERLRKALQ